MFKFHFQLFSLFLSVFILVTFFGFLFAWTGPTSAPPGSNVSTPVNVGTADQSKAGRLSATEFYDTDNSSFYINPSGDSMISGMLSLGGDLYDLTNSKKIYDSTTGKFDPSVMPYEKGDLVSDWATSSYTSGYYDVVSAGDVKQGVSFGRGETGSLVPGGTAAAGDVRSGKTFYSGSWTQKTGAALVCDGTWVYLWVYTGTTLLNSHFDGDAVYCNSATLGIIAYQNNEYLQPVKPGDAMESTYYQTQNYSVNEMKCIRYCDE